MHRRKPPVHIAFVPTVAASAVLVAAADADTAARYVPGLVDGSLTGAVATGGSVTVTGATATGVAGTVLGGGAVEVILCVTGDDFAVVDVGTGVTVETPANLDPTRRCARVSRDGAAATVLPGAAGILVDLTRVILAAEAVGIASECTDSAAAYAKERTSGHDLMAANTRSTSRVTPTRRH